MTEDSWVSLVEHLIWPVVVLIVVLALRRQIGDFLSALGGRITKVSLMSVTIDLAVATEAAPPWRGVGGEDVRGLVVAQQVNDSYFDTLRQSLETAGTADYFVADLKGDGQEEWLSSRLYLFTYLLSRMKGVRSIVFTATRGDVGLSYLGVADAAELLQALSREEPWLHLARLQVEAEQVGRLPDLGPVVPSPVAPPDVPPVNGPAPLDIDAWWLGVRANTTFAAPLYMAQRFLEHVQWVQPPGSMDAGAGWLRLPDTPGRQATWEHARWLTASDLIDGALSTAVRPDGYVLDDRSWSAEDRVRAVARARGDLVALLDQSRRFDRLVDRRALLEKLGAATVEP
jgi:hypothetical protein